MTEVARLSLYGEYAKWLVDMGIKQLTLRKDKSKYEDLKPGVNIVIKYDEGVGIGIVFGRQIKPLGEFTEAELLLDGFLSHSEAVEVLRQFPGYKNITLKTNMLGVAFTDDSYFSSYLTKEEQKLMFKTPLAEAVKMSEFNQFFLPAYMGWASFKSRENGSNITVAKWHDLLISKGIVDSERLEAVRHVDKATEKFYKGLREKEIKRIWSYELTKSPKYQSLVLCRPVSVS